MHECGLALAASALDAALLAAGCGMYGTTGALLRRTRDWLRCSAFKGILRTHNRSATRSRRYGATRRLHSPGLTTMCMRRPTRSDGRESLSRQPSHADHLCALGRTPVQSSVRVNSAFRANDPALGAAWGNSAKAKAKRGAALFSGSSASTPLSVSSEEGMDLHGGMQCALQGVRQKLEVRSPLSCCGDAAGSLTPPVAFAV
jgi:hypothetical protein